MSQIKLFTMFLEVFIIVAILLGIATVGFAITMLIKKEGKFPNTHVGRSKAMKERGVHCARTTDRLDRENYKPIEIKKKS